jgi:putative acetyltransferase
MMIRAEQPSEYGIVEIIHESAFGGKNEADVVRAIRLSAGYRPEWSLVCEESGHIPGHVMFSYVGLEGDEGSTRQIVVLAPLAVLPERQRRGVGSALVLHGIGLLESLSEPLIVVRGDFAYYSRFGFRPSIEVGIHASFPVTADHYLAKTLPVYTTDYRGIVRYPATFRAVGYKAESSRPREGRGTQKVTDLRGWSGCE